MSSIDPLERKYGKYLPENLTYYLIIGQIIAYVISFINHRYAGFFPLQGQLLLEGQWWRLLTFVFTPVSDSLLFAALAWYFLYLYGVMLEQRWGSFRYLTYLLISYLGSIICAFLFPQQIITNGYLYTSLFLAFAYLYPDVRLLLFFIIPVKVQWLGILTWIGVGSTILFGSLPTQILTGLSLSNFFFFFGKDIVVFFRRYPKKISPVWEPLREKKTTMNICAVCDRNDIDHRSLDFRFCMDCNPPTCYCEEHLESHRHKKIRLVH